MYLNEFFFLRTAVVGWVASFCNPTWHWQGVYQLLVVQQLRKFTVGLQRHATQPAVQFLFNIFMNLFFLF